MAANRTGTGKTEPESPKPNRLRFTTKPEKPETGETETAVLNRFPKNPKNPDKASTRISNFSVAREYARIPPGRGGEPPLLGDHLHSLSNTREIRISSDRLGKVFF